jgi:hypothetical protein
MNKKDAAKILNEIKESYCTSDDEEDKQALEVAIRCLKGQKSKAKGGSAAKKKGANGEREWSAKCKEQGYNTRRGQQFCGLNGNADVVGLPYIHSEVKRVENLNLYDAMAQSIRDKKENEIPIVAHRKNNCEWLVSMRAEDWFKLYKSWESERK